MKKFLIIILALAITFATIGCQKEEAVQESTIDEEPEAEVEEGEEAQGEEPVSAGQVAASIETISPRMIPVDTDKLPEEIQESDLEQGLISAHKLIEIARNLGKEITLFGSDGCIYTVKNNTILSQNTEIAKTEEETEEKEEESNKEDTQTNTASTNIATSAGTSNSGNSSAGNNASNASSGNHNNSSSSASHSSSSSNTASSSSNSSSSSSSSGSSSNSSNTSSGSGNTTSNSTSGNNNDDSTTSHTHTYGDWVLDIGDNTGTQFRRCIGDNGCGQVERKDAGKRWIVDVPAKDAEYVEIPHYDSYQVWWTTYTTNLDNHNDKASWITKEFIIGYDSTIEEYNAFDKQCQQKNAWINGGYYPIEIYTHSDWIETSPAQEEQGHWEYYIQ